MNELYIATDASVALNPELVKRYRVLVVPREAKLGRRGMSASDAQQLQLGNLPMLVPARVQAFAEAFRKFTHADIVTLHAPAQVDNAVQQAHLAATMVAPHTHVEVYESQNFHWGLALLVETAARFVYDGAGTVTTEQVLILLRRLEAEMTSLLFVQGLNGLPCEPLLSLRQKISARFGKGVPIRYSDEDQIFRQLRPAELERLWASEEAGNLQLEWYRRSPHGTARLEQRAAELVRARRADFSELRIRNPALPRDFVQVTAYPSPARRAALVAWVNHWSTLQEMALVE